MVVGFYGDRAFRCILEHITRQCCLHLVYVEAAGTFHCSFVQPRAQIRGLCHVANHGLLTPFLLERFYKFLVDGRIQRLKVLHGSIETGQVFTADAQYFILRHGNSQHGLLAGIQASCIQLFEPGHVTAAHDRCVDHVRLLQLDFIDHRTKLGIAQGDVLFTYHGATQMLLDVLAGDLHGGAWPDVVRADQVISLGFLFLGNPVQACQNLLSRFLTGVEHVLGLFQAFIERRIEQQAIVFLEHWQRSLA